MFTNPRTLKRMMKEAFKAKNLIVGSRDGMIYMQGVYWKLLCKREYIPKTILAELIELTGEIPETGECYCAGKDGNQAQFNDMKVDIPETAKLIGVTDFILKGKTGVLQRILQFDSGEIYLINDKFIDMMRGKHYDIEKGETEPAGPYCDPAKGIFWRNEVMTFSTLFRVDDEHYSTLTSMETLELSYREEPDDV